MDDFKINKALKTAFDDFELSPNKDLFAKITDRVNEQNKERKPINKYANYRYLGLFTLLFSLGTIYFLNTNIVRSGNYQILNTATDSKLNTKDNFIQKIKSTSNKENNSEFTEEKTKPILLINNNLEFENKEILPTKEQKNQSKTTRIVSKNQISDQNLYDRNSFGLLKKNYSTKEEKGILIGVQRNLIRNSVKDEKQTFIYYSFNDLNSKSIGTGNVDKVNLANGLVINNLKALNNVALINRLKNKGLPISIAKIPKKDLPKINKTTPLAIEIGINPFYAFQKIEPTEAGLANIQNISTGNIETKQRMGFALNAAYVLNWTKQSRLRLGVSYRDIFQKVGYEQATDIYDLQTINNQTVLVRKGIPYAEEKRNQLIGIKADRQFFLQLSTPTRFYASLGAEYTKAFKSKTQMLFVNSTMGIDMPLKNKWRLQIEPSYSYALLGTTDANKFVNINPNHFGLKLGFLYEIRK